MEERKIKLTVDSEELIFLFLSSINFMHGLINASEDLREIVGDVDELDIEDSDHFAFITSLSGIQTALKFVDKYHDELTTILDEIKDTADEGYINELTKSLKGYALIVLRVSDLFSKTILDFPDLFDVDMEDEEMTLEQKLTESLDSFDIKLSTDKDSKE